MQFSVCAVLRRCNQSSTRFSTLVAVLLLVGGGQAYAQSATGNGAGPAPLPDGLFEVEEGPYLSNLSATAADPLFATYAAPLRRSEFIVDEGYQFKFYEANEGLRFATDHAGD